MKTPKVHVPTHLWLLAFILILPFVLGLPLWLGKRIFIYRDFFNQYLAFADFSRQALKQGEIPFWNPFAYNGSAFFANLQSCVFYPPNLLTTALPIWSGFHLSILLHFPIAALGMRELGRYFKLSPLAQAFSAITFAGGSALIATLDTLTAFQAIAWMPWVVYGGLRWATAPGLPSTALFALFLALQFLAAEPLFLAISVLLVLILCPSLGKKHLVLSPLVFIGWFGLIGFQLLPFLYEIRQSVRAQGYDASFVSFWSLHPLELLNLFFPWLFGGLTDKWFGQEWLRGLYIGIIPLSCLVFLRWKEKSLRSMYVAFGLFLVLAMSGFIPGLPTLMARVPIISQNRFPSKFFIPCLFILTLLCGFALDHSKNTTKKRQELWRWGLLTLAAMGVGLAVFLHPVIGYVQNLFPDHTYASEGARYLLRRPLILRTSLCVLVLILTLSTLSRFRLKPDLRFAIVILSLIELLLYLPFFIKTGTVELITHVPSIAKAVEPHRGSIFWASGPESAHQWLHNRSQNDVFLLAKETYAPGFNQIYSLKSATGYQGIVPRNNAAWEHVIQQLFRSDPSNQLQGLLRDAGVQALSSFVSIDKPYLRLLRSQPIFLYAVEPVPNPCLIVETQSLENFSCHVSQRTQNVLEMTWSDISLPSHMILGQSYDARWQAFVNQEPRPLRGHGMFNQSTSIDLAPTDQSLTLRYQEIGWPYLGVVALIFWPFLIMGTLITLKPQILITPKRWLARLF